MATERLALDPADYWMLMALQLRAENAELRAQLSIARANATAIDHQRTLAAKYPGFDLDGRYGTDDATCSLTREEAQQ